MAAIRRQLGRWDKPRRSHVATYNIYDEGTEWTPTASSHLNAASTNNPYHLTKDTEATSAVLGNSVSYLDPNSATVNLGTVNNLVFYLQSKAAWPTGASGSTAARYLNIYWQNGSTTKGNTVVLRDGQFGFSSSNTTAYQQISIPASLFGINGIPVTKLVFQVSGPSGSSSLGFYLDEVTLQGGSYLPSTTASQPYDIVCSFVGKPPASQTVLELTLNRPVSFAPNFAGSNATLGANPTSTAAYTLKQNGTTIGTVSISTTGVFTFSTSNAAGVTLAAGDRLTITAPASQDSTLSDVAMTFAGTR